MIFITITQQEGFEPFVSSWPTMEAAEESFNEMVGIYNDAAVNYTAQLYTPNFIMLPDNENGFTCVRRASFDVNNGGYKCT